MKLVLLAHVKETIRLVMCPEIYPSLSIVLRRADFPARHCPGPYRPTGRSQQRRLGTDPDLLNYGQQTYFKASNTGAVNTFGSSVATSGHTVVVGAPYEDSNATEVNGEPGRTIPRATPARSTPTRSYPPSPTCLSATGPGCTSKGWPAPASPTDTARATTALRPAPPARRLSFSCCARNMAPPKFRPLRRACSAMSPPTIGPPLGSSNSQRRASPAGAEVGSTVPP